MYVKLFEKILDSTINETDLPTRWTWITCLLLADQDGCFTATPGAIARRGNLTVDQVRAALEHLTSPDINSTTTTNDGRRLIETSSNRWQVVNYAHYRRIASRDDDRVASRERMRQKRSGEKINNSDDVRFCSDVFDSVRLSSKCSASEAEAEAEAYIGDSTSRPEVATEPPKHDPLKRVSLNEGTWTFSGIQDSDREAWAHKAPNVDIDRELDKLIRYYQARPGKLAQRRKGGRWIVTIENWLVRAQEYAERDGARKPRLNSSIMPSRPVKTQRVVEMNARPATDADIQTWHAASNLMQSRDSAAWSKWISPLIVGSLSDGRLVLIAADEYTVDYISHNLGESIKAALHDVEPGRGFVVVASPACSTRS